MISIGRVLSTSLLPLTTTGQFLVGPDLWESISDLYSVPNGSPASSLSNIWTLPQNFYPLKGVNQIILRWFVSGFNGTYAQLTPITFRAFIPNGAGTTAQPGYINKGTAIYEFFKLQFDQFDTTNNVVLPHPYTIKKTGNDTTTTMNGNTFNIGTRHMLPVPDPYFAVLIEDDGSATQHRASVDICFA